MLGGKLAFLLLLFHIYMIFTGFCGNKGSYHKVGSLAWSLSLSSSSSEEVSWKGFLILSSVDVTSSSLAETIISFSNGTSIAVAMVTS